MIDGLKATVWGTEVLHMVEERAKEYRALIREYQEMKVQPANIDSKIKSLTRRAEEMEFLAKHINVTETYLLGDGDLAKLGKAEDWL